jgi:hypothetical protein
VAQCGLLMRHIVRVRAGVGDWPRASGGENSNRASGFFPRRSLVAYSEAESHVVKIDQWQELRGRNDKENQRMKAASFK